MTDRSKKITELAAASSAVANDLLVAVTNTSSNAVTKKITVGAFFSNVVANTKFSNTVAFGSNVAFSGTISVGGNTVIAANGAWTGNSTGLKGEVGAKGDKGEVGTTGSKGDKGQYGEKGEPGVTGSKGDTGTTGSTGAKGDKGDTGSTGTTGSKGDKGDTGTTGAKGDTGSAGTKGDKGDTGTTGTAGSKGDKGDTGTTGTAGDKGDKGDTGTTGTAGSKGDKGDTGTTGTAGDKGDKGDTGTTGAKGDTGTLTGTVTGDLIPDTDNAYSLGNTTHRFAHLYVSAGSVTVGNLTLSTTSGGLSVSDSNTGQPATITAGSITMGDYVLAVSNTGSLQVGSALNPNTAPTAVGTGDKGDKGDKGDTGTAGSKGQKGERVSSASYDDANNTLSFTNSDATSFDVVGVKGQKGIKGDAGNLALTKSGGSYALSNTAVLWYDQHNDQIADAGNVLRLYQPVNGAPVEVISNGYFTSALGFKYSDSGYVSQTGSRSNGVTLNKPAGDIALYNASMTTTQVDAIAVNNSFVTANSMVLVNVMSSGNYLAGIVSVIPGTMLIWVRNISGSTTSAESPVIRFRILQ